MRTIISFTGASGSAVGVEFLKRCPGEKYIILSRWGRSVLYQETGLTPKDLATYADKIFSWDDMNSPFASGSVPFDHYVILPCSVSTMGRIANGISDNLVTRVGEVALKENRRMVLALRETPLSPVALENALKLARLGVTVMPLSPAFYMKAGSMNEMIENFAGHILTTLQQPSRPGWREEELPVRS